MNISFRLAQDDEKHQFLKGLTEKVSQSIIAEFGRQKSFSSLYLAGSLSRGEGSVVKIEDRFLLLSDFDFLIITKDGKTAHLISRRIPSFLKDINTQYRESGILSYIDCGAIDRESLRSLKPTLFWYEFIKQGKLISGTDEKIKEIINWDHLDVSPDEALILLHNRAIEQLMYLPPIKPRDQFTKEHFAKILYLCSRTFCDLAKSYLLHRGMYDETIQGRLEKIKKVEGTVLNYELLEQVALWSAFKLDPSMELILRRFNGDWATSPEILQKVQESLYTCLMTLWKLEVNELYHMNFATLDENLWGVSPKGSGLISRGREWLSYVKHELLQKRPVPLRKIPYYILYNHTPLWVSHLSALMLYELFFRFKHNDNTATAEFSRLLRFVAERLPHASKKDLKHKEFLDDWNELRVKALQVWGMVALGGRQELGV